MAVDGFDSSVVDVIVPASPEDQCGAPHPLYGARCVFQAGHGTLTRRPRGITHLAYYGRTEDNSGPRKLIWTTAVTP